jgi:hypothetical protein
VADYDAKWRAVQLCTEGEAAGDVGKLDEAFHADARMFGSLAGTRYDVPIAELVALAKSAGRHRQLRSRILSVQQTGDAAVAVVAEESHWGTVSFIDYLQASRCRLIPTRADGSLATVQVAKNFANQPAVETCVTMTSGWSLLDRFGALRRWFTEGSYRMHRPSPEEFLRALLETLDGLPPDFVHRLEEVLRKDDTDRAQAIRELFEDVAGD